MAVDGHDMTATGDVFLEAASTMAVIASSSTPLLFLDADLTVIAASHSFCRVFGIQEDHVVGRSLGSVGAGEWDAPQLAVLLKATAAGFSVVDGYEMALRQSGAGDRRVLIEAHQLEYVGAEHRRILLAVSDVTLARATEKANAELLHEKAMRLQEVQHRIANSLQIIASILMQSARRIQSEEARHHIQDAHHRVLSLAAVQRYLIVADVETVALRPYLTHLCESLAASMIPEPGQISLVVEVDDTVLPANASVSVGLLVTELVINALKHAFPDQRKGVIRIQYAKDGSGWHLNVNDDGVGMPPADPPAKAGLGTSIVEALARQLQATVSLDATGRGMSVTIEYRNDEMLPKVLPL